MKLPNDTSIKEVATYYRISTKGRMQKWLSLMTPNAAVYYYNNEGKLVHTRVSRLQRVLNCG